MFFIRDWEPCFASIFKDIECKNFVPCLPRATFTIVPAINTWETYDSHFANVSHCIIEGQLDLVCFPLNISLSKRETYLQGRLLVRNSQV